MIAKEHFINFFENFDKFTSSLEIIDKAITGKTWSDFIWDSEPVVSVQNMVDAFIRAHFTDYGTDLIYGYYYDNINKKELVITNADKSKIVIDTLDKLYDYLINNGYAIN